MRISCWRNVPSAPTVGASLFVNFGRGVSLPFRSRFTCVSLACRRRVSQKQQKTLIRTNAPLVQVRLRGAREPRAKGVHRRSAKEAQILLCLFAPSPLTLEGRSGNGSRSRPAEGPAARRTVSYP